METQPDSLASLSDAERLVVLRSRAEQRRATGEIPDRFDARVSQHFNRILQHIRSTDDVDDPLIAAAVALGTGQRGPDAVVKAKGRRTSVMSWLHDLRNRNTATDHARIAALEETVRLLVARVRELERREHRVTDLTDQGQLLRGQTDQLLRRMGLSTEELDDLRGLDDTAEANHERQSDPDTERAGGASTGDGGRSSGPDE